MAAATRRRVGNRDAAAEAGDDRLRDRETQAAAVGVHGASGRAAIEPIEDMRPFRRIDPDARVDDVKSAGPGRRARARGGP